MDYIRGLEAYQDSREAAITLGKFDGVHRGHQKLIKKVCQLKAKKGVRSVVFAFDMNPLYEKLGKSREGIMSNEERMSFGRESRCTAGMPVFRRCHKYVGRGFHPEDPD